MTTEKPCPYCGTQMHNAPHLSNPWPWGSGVPRQLGAVFVCAGCGNRHVQPVVIAPTEPVHSA